MSWFLAFAAKEPFYKGWRLVVWYDDHANNCRKWVFGRDADKRETIVVEGKESIAAIQAFLEEVAKRFPDPENNVERALRHAQDLAKRKMDPDAEREVHFIINALRAALQSPEYPPRRSSRS